MKVEVFFDYTCPFCFIGLNYLNELKDYYPEIEYDWVLCEAHPEPETKMSFRKNSGFWQKGILPLAAKGNVKINYPNTPISYSNKAIEGFLYLNDRDVSDKDIVQYHKNILNAVYLDAKDIGDYNVILAAMKNLAVDSSQLIQDLESGKYSKAQKELNDYAYHQKEILVLPTFAVGTRRLEAALGVGIEKDALKTYLDRISGR